MTPDQSNSNSISISNSADADAAEVKQRALLVEWLLNIVPNLSLPSKASEEDLRACLLDGTVLCQILKGIRPFLLNEGNHFDNLSPSASLNIKKFLRSMDVMGIPKFEMSDLEQGSMKPVIKCLTALRGQSTPPAGDISLNNRTRSVGDASFHTTFSPLPGEGRHRDPSASVNHSGHKFHEVFQVKPGRYSDLPAAKISEMMKSNSLDNAPTQSLLSVVNGILDESLERTNGEIPHRVACLLRKVVQEIERRISTQAEHLRTQNNLFKAREEKYQSRLRVLEALASGSGEEIKTTINHLQHIKVAKYKIEVDNKLEENLVRQSAAVEVGGLKQELMKERDQRSTETEALKQELMKEKDQTTAKIESLKQELMKEKDQSRAKIESLKQELMKEKDQSWAKIESLKQELMKEKDQSTAKIQSLKQELMKERDQSSTETGALKQELTKERDQSIESLKQELMKEKDQSLAKIESLEQELRKEKDENKAKIESLKQELTKEKDESMESLKQELMKEKDESWAKIESLKQELMKTKDQSSTETGALKEELTKERDQSIESLKQELMKEKDQSSAKIESLKQEMMKEKDQSTAKMESLKQELMKEKDQSMESLKQELMKERNRSIESLQQELIQERDQSTAKIESLKQELMKEKDQNTLQIKALKQELVNEKEKNTDQIAALKQELMKEKNQITQELETTTKAYEQRCSQLERDAKAVKAGLEEKVGELEQILLVSKNKVKELQANLDTKSKSWNKKEQTLKTFINFQFRALQELRLYSKSIEQQVLGVQNSYSNDFNILGKKLVALGDAAANYHAVLAENRKFFNELQELKGNIRVYCRVRPGQTGKKASTIEEIGENGELVVANPAKPGKEGQRQFKFNKVYGPAATQGEVFSDTRPLIRSVLDGYNVCIFAYGQTGSGKTYTMTGPDNATEEEWGVNYRALNDLFNISQTRKTSVVYEVGVQMVEVYNEQIRDLLSNESSQKRLGILSTTQETGLAVPDASMQPVISTSDVMDYIQLGLKNRAVGATAMNDRSSRSHSIVTIHVRGKDLKNDSTLYGNLHLVDLAGSERVDRSEVTGDRLREAQHINKSLSALGDVIFALAQKSSHVPYRNSKLTQLLQSSLGGQAKTLMFVQLNPDVTSYAESMSTLKFAERVSGVELGAAKSSKDGRDAKELMDQVASLKNTISKKDEEIERLQLLKDIKNVYPSRNQRQISRKGAFDKDNFSDGGSQISTEDLDQQRDEDEAEEGGRLSDASGGTEADASADNASSLERPKSSDKNKPVRKVTRPLQKLRAAGSVAAAVSAVKSSPASSRKTIGGSSPSPASLKPSPGRKWQ